MAQAAGWFADPGGSAQERYWDGAQWTEHLRAPMAVPAAPTPGWGATPAPAPGWGAAPAPAPRPQVPPPPPGAPGGPGGAYVPYSPQPPPRALGGASGRYGFAAAILGLQSGPLVIFGILTLGMVSMFNQLGYGYSRGSGGLAGWGLVLFLVGVGFFSSAAGVAMARRWGRLLAFILEGGSILLIIGSALYSVSEGTSAAVLFFAMVWSAAPIIVIVCLIEDQTS